MIPSSSCIFLRLLLLCLFLLPLPLPLLLLFLLLPLSACLLAALSPSLPYLSVNPGLGCDLGVSLASLSLSASFSCSSTLVCQTCYLLFVDYKPALRLTHGRARSGDALDSIGRRRSIVPALSAPVLDLSEL